MRRRDFVGYMGSVAVLWPPAALAQQPARVQRVGVLMGGNASVEAARLDAFRGALEKLGYTDGQNVVFEMRYAEGRPDRFGALARELVAATPAVIACVGRQETAALQAATRTIPIVFMQTPNPVELGLVASLARPGGNTTGFMQMSAELDLKRLEFLHEIAPALSRAAFLINPNFLPGVEERFAGAAAAAKSLGIGLRRAAATTPAELIAALAVIEAASDQALLVQNDPMLSGTEESRVLAFAAGHRLLTVFEYKGGVAQGGLLSYGNDPVRNARLAAGYVAEILMGANPADLPIQQPTTFELVINLKTARTLGLAVPQSLLLRADEVIE